jgi:hypothetical protein
MKVKKTGKLSKDIVGAAGEYCVAGELSRLGYIVTLTRNGTAGVDRLAVKPGTHSGPVLIQARMRQGNPKRRRWPLRDSALREPCDVLIFVLLRDPNDRPENHIAPIAQVKRHARRAHRALFRRHPGNKDSSQRAYRAHGEQDRDNWELLEQVPGQPTLWETWVRLPIQWQRQ